MSCPVYLQNLPSGVFEEVFTPENMRRRSSVSSLTQLSFPKSRSALWDSSPAGEKLRLQLCSHRKPRVVLLEKALRLAQRHVRHSNKPRLHCFFLGSLTIDAGEDGVTVTLDRFDPGRDQASGRVPSALLPGDVLVSCLFSVQAEATPDAVVQSEAELHQCFKLLQQFLSSRQTLDLSQLLKIRAHVFCSQQSDAAAFSLSWSAVCPAVSVDVQPVRAVPIIPTALLRSLTGAGRPLQHSGRQRGFLTMDQTRKLVLLLESDPKASKLPLVGLWLSGVTHVSNPQVWAWCLRFMFSSALQDRVLSESSCFLLVVFASTHRAPQFFQCRGSGPGPGPGPGPQLGFHLLTASQSVTLYQVAPADGRALQCELGSEDGGRQAEVFRTAQISFSSSPPPAAGLSVSDQDSGVEDEDFSPRPSPSPHPPAPQARRIQPSVPELSLLIDSSFSSNHSAGSAHRPPTDRKSAPPPGPASSSASKPAPPPHLHSTPNSNLQQPCTCCSTHNCTSIFPSPALLPAAAPPASPHHTPRPANLHPAQPPSSTRRKTPPPSNQHSAPPPSLPQQTPPPSNLQSAPPPSSSHRQTSPPSNFNSSPLPPSFSQQTPPPSNQHFAPPPSSSHRQTSPPSNFNSSPLPPSFSQQTPPPSNLHFAPPPSSSHRQTSPPSNFNSSPLPPSFSQQTPPPSNQHFAPPPSSSHRQTSPPSNFNSSPLPSSPHLALPPPSSHQYFPPTLPASTRQPAPSFGHPPPLHHNSPRLSSSPSTLLLPPDPSSPCIHPPPAVPWRADPPSPACVNRCCDHAVPPDTYQLLLHQDRQLRLLQAQVQMLLEAQGKLQSSTQTPRSTTSIAVETGASLFWGSDPQQEEPASSPKPPPSASSPKPPPSASSSHDLSVRRPVHDITPGDDHSGRQSPVLGESASMYEAAEEQQSFYQNLMTQLNSRLQEADSKQEAEEESRRRSLSQSSRSSQSSQSSQSSRSSRSSSSSSQRKPSPQGDPVIRATLRQLQQLGVDMDQEELTEADRTRLKAVESASMLASINPAAVVSRLSVSEPTTSALFPGGSVDLSLEANAIALRYLSDSQLSRLSLGGHTPQKVPAPSSTDSLLSPSNMSLATRKYMRRYGLIEEEDGEEEARQPLTEAQNVKLLPQSQLIRDLRPKMQLLADGTEPDGEDKENRSTGRPSLIRARSRQPEGSVGNILDLSRLRQLPKLF
ncbi:SCL-interrupting locus protein homolog [Leuresthes tenuis]|uniref:SCL-interrupting locus protein homolog n=1 Tax=Leuresthes tenuis TaxID=355514 RepID=UPI003B50D284